MSRFQRSSTAVVEWYPNKNTSKLRGADYYTLHQYPTAGYREMNNEMMTPVDWAKLNSGGGEHNNIVRNMMKRVKMPMSNCSSWPLNISHDVGLAIAWQSEEAYLLDFAKKYSDYKKIFYRLYRNVIAHKYGK